MKKSIRIIFSILFIAAGIGALILGGFALLHVRDLATAGLLLSMLLFGVAMILVGVAIARRESVRDLLQDLFSVIYF